MNREFEARVADRGQHMLLGPVPEQVQHFVEIAKLREFATSVAESLHDATTIYASISLTWVYGHF